MSLFPRTRAVRISISGYFSKLGRFRTVNSCYGEQSITSKRQANRILGLDFLTNSIVASIYFIYIRFSDWDLDFNYSSKFRITRDQERNLIGHAATDKPTCCCLLQLFNHPQHPLLQIVCHLIMSSFDVRICETFTAPTNSTSQLIHHLVRCYSMS